MTILWENDFCLKAQKLYYRYDYANLNKILTENKDHQLCHHEKAIAMYEVLCARRLNPDIDAKQVIEDLQRTLAYNGAESGVETELLNAQIYIELVQVYMDMLKQYTGITTRLYKRAEAAFDHAIKMYGQFYQKDWQLQRWFTDLFIFMKSIGARMHLKIEKSDTARNYVQIALDMCVQTHSFCAVVECYIIKALCASRRGGIDTFESNLKLAKSIAEVVGATKHFKHHFRAMDKLLLLHEDEVWRYKGKKLMEYSGNQIEVIYARVQEHKMDKWIDPIFREKYLG